MRNEHFSNRPAPRNKKAPAAAGSRSIGLVIREPLLADAA